MWRRVDRLEPAVALGIGAAVGAAVWWGAAATALPAFAVWAGVALLAAAVVLAFSGKPVAAPAPAAMSKYAEQHVERIGAAANISDPSSGAVQTARIILLDATAGNSLLAEDVLAHVPAGVRSLPPLRLTAFGAPPVIRSGPGAHRIDWSALATALTHLIEAARAQGHAENPPAHTIVAGQAPLPVFVAAGHELSHWLGEVTVLNRRGDGTWDVVSLDASDPPSERDPFDHVSGLPVEPSVASGVVAVFVSTRGMRVNGDDLAAFCRRRSQPVAGLVEICSESPLVLDAGNARRAFVQIKRGFARVHDLFPKRDALAVLVDGPATLAFMVGRAIRGYDGVVLVPNYLSSDHGYELAFTLPLPASPRDGAEITVLFCTALPESLDDLDIARELDSIATSVRDPIAVLRFNLVSLWNITPAGFLRAMNVHRPVIVHFSGHGTSDGIVLMDDGGGATLVRQAALVEMFRSFSCTQLVVLDTSDSIGHARALSQFVGCTIGMPADLDDDAARIFAAAFYQALAFNRSVKDGLDQGRAAISLYNLPMSGQPCLFTREGVDAAQVFFAPLERRGDDAT